VTRQERVEVVSMTTVTVMVEPNAAVVSLEKLENAMDSNAEVSTEKKTDATEKQAGPPNYFKTLMPAFVCVFVDYFGYGVSIPILPYFALELGASSTQVGIMIGV
jgi:hypothetical protein